MKIILNTIILLSFVSLMASCSSRHYRDETSMQIGCASSEVIISNKKSRFLGSSSSWTATCNNKEYFCKSIPRLRDGMNVNCEEVE